jgi:hypothetical protein
VNIHLFNFLEDNNSQIVSTLRSTLSDEHPVYQEISPETLKDLLERIADAYIDLLVTGQTDAADLVFRALSRVLAVRGSKLSDVFKLPLHLDAVIRRLLLDKYKDATDGNEALEKFARDIEIIEATTHRMSCRFLDVFQELMDERIASHNSYLERMQQESGVDLEPFKLVPATN